MTLTPERKRELAAIVAQAVVSEPGAHYLPYLDSRSVRMRLPAVPEFDGLSFHDDLDLCGDIAALAKTARVTITIPEETV